MSFSSTVSSKISIWIFERMSVFDSILQYNPDLCAEDLNAESASTTATKLGIKVKESWGLGKIQIEIFEATVEEKLIQPTFITEYPTEVSPLARRNDNNPFITDRFELFIGGREIANGFSELNDAEDQAERFKRFLHLNPLRKGLDCTAKLNQTHSCAQRL
jgi:lysyl-tRNA synthetase class 2